MIQSMRKDGWKEYDSLFDALELKADHREIISLTGGGGKTTVIRRLQKECMERRIFHGVSTTTHMQYEKNESFLGSPSLESFLKIYKKTGTVWMGEPVSQLKMKGFPNVFYEQIVKTGAWLLLEADGARYLPVKVPAVHEPVILPETTMVCNVYGLDAPGRTIEEICFRSQLAAQILGKKETDLLEERDLVFLAASMQGGKKQVEDREYHVILNKADTQERRKSARKIGHALKKLGIKHVHMTADLL